MIDDKRTRKANEIHAEYLLKVSSTLLIAFFIAILVVPVTAIMKSVFSDNASSISLLTMLINLGGIKIIVFLLCEFGVFYLSGTFRERALDIYDELYPDKTE
jgi:hypothetical protein